MSEKTNNTAQNQQAEKPELSENELIALRREKLAAQRAECPANGFPNDFVRDSFAQDIHDKYMNDDKEKLAELKPRVKIAGRMMMCRLMGKASFVHLQDMTGKIQLYVRKNDLPNESDYEQFKSWDLGDILAAEGYVFRTKTGELSVHVESIKLMTKALRPLPDKFHGLTDQESKYRQRYLDLLVNTETRAVFETRSKIVNHIRHFLTERRYTEVETPMMHSIPGGAIAKPFITHHNTLDMELYLRIAPELFLKRLVVGGMERVFEINRNFRNEGLSTRHNPEFTMLEFYQAYATYKDLMDLSEQLFKELAEQVYGNAVVTYQEHEIDFSKSFARISVKQSILDFNPEIKAEDLEDLESAKNIAKNMGIKLEDSYGLGKVQIEIFEKTVEHRLIQPTFITEYPAEVSPLARRNNENPFITDRFELFVGGREIANGFSELNDSEDQAERFQKQVEDKASGDEEAMGYDEDYIRALEHGLPPTAGEGIGIDRLVMLFTNSPSIRDVILFPQMRKQAE